MHAQLHKYKSTVRGRSRTPVHRVGIGTPIEKGRRRCSNSFSEQSKCCIHPAGDTTGSVGCRTLPDTPHRLPNIRVLSPELRKQVWCVHPVRVRHDRKRRLRHAAQVTENMSSFPQSCTATKILFLYSFSGNCAASVPISTFMCLWVIYIFPGSILIFSCSRIGRSIMGIYKSLTDTWMWKLGLWLSQFLFW